ncbi:MAG TPA: hypothetical protein VFF73_40865 [Planctomycetota bacterium]|nr:hypothetical protein [Planctomycetota bacterium]
MSVPLASGFWLLSPSTIILRPERRAPPPPPPYELYDEEAALELEALWDEWPAPTPVVFIRGEPGPTVERTWTCTPVRTAQLLEAAKASQWSRVSPRDPAPSEEAPPR